MRTRWWQHCNDALVRRTPYAFAKAIRKYGIDDWVTEILHLVANWDEATLLEIQEIARHKTYGRGGYNMTCGGEGILGVKRDPIVSERVAAMHRGRKRPKETGERIAARKNSRERTQSETEGHKRTSQINRTRPRSKVECAAIAKALLGHTVSAETRGKISASNMGKKMDPEIVARVTAKITGPNSRLAKRYIVTHLDGREEEILGLSHFCRKVGIFPNAARITIRFPGRTAKGMKFRPVEPVVIASYCQDVAAIEVPRSR
jgi:hypothetical protein